MGFLMGVKNTILLSQEASSFKTSGLTFTIAMVFRDVGVGSSVGVAVGGMDVAIGVRVSVDVGVGVGVGVANNSCIMLQPTVDIMNMVTSVNLNTT